MEFCKGGPIFVWIGGESASVSLSGVLPLGIFRLEGKFLKNTVQGIYKREKTIKDHMG